MMVRIMYAHGGYDLVKDQILDLFLERGAIARFQRCDGWVVIGRDQIRKRLRTQMVELYSGIERRRVKSEDACMSGASRLTGTSN